MNTKRAHQHIPIRHLNSPKLIRQRKRALKAAKRIDPSVLILKFQEHIFRQILLRWATARWWLSPREKMIWVECVMRGVEWVRQ